MTTPPTPQPAPLPERVQEMLAATEGHTAGLTMRVENDETDGDDLGYGCVQFPWRIHVSTGQALIIEVGALGDDMAHADAALIAAAPTLRALLAETAAALAAAEAREAGLRAALERACVRLNDRAAAHEFVGKRVEGLTYARAAGIVAEEHRAALGGQS